MLCVSYALCAQAGGIWHMLSLSAFIITIPLLAKKHAAAKVGRSQRGASMHARACPVVFVLACGFCIACCCCCRAYGGNTGLLLLRLLLQTSACIVSTLARQRLYQHAAIKRGTPLPMCPSLHAGRVLPMDT